MSRVKGGMTTRRKHKSILKQVKGQKSLSPAFWSIKAWKKNFPL